jgi:hypothetical protein
MVNIMSFYIHVKETEVDQASAVSLGHSGTLSIAALISFIKLFDIATERHYAHRALPPTD